LLLAAQVLRPGKCDAGKRVCELKADALVAEAIVAGGLEECDESVVPSDRTKASDVWQLLSLRSVWQLLSLRAEP
jgi:hypothetical protein